MVTCSQILEPYRGTLDMRNLGLLFPHYKFHIPKEKGLKKLLKVATNSCKGLQMRSFLVCDGSTEASEPDFLGKFSAVLYELP
jgi:hypothetical protein